MITVPAYSPTLLSLNRSFSFFVFPFFVFLYCEMGWTMRQRRRRLCSIFTVKWNTCQGSNSSAIYGAQTVAARRQWRRRHLLSLSDLVNFAHLKRGTSRWPYQKGPPLLYSLSLLNTWLLHMCVFQACVCVWNDHTFNLARQFPALTAVSLSVSLAFSSSLSITLALFPSPCQHFPFHSLGFAGLTIQSRLDYIAGTRCPLKFFSLLLFIVLQQPACLPAWTLIFSQWMGKTFHQRNFTLLIKLHFHYWNFLKKSKNRKENTQKYETKLSIFISIFVACKTAGYFSLSLSSSLSHTLLQSSSFMPWKY